jgi:hypothetical protein
MKHTFTIHSNNLNLTIDEQKTCFDQFFGRGRKNAGNEYKIADFDIVRHAFVTNLCTKLDSEDYSKIYTFLEGIERSVKEGFCRVASNLISSSTNTLDEVETVKCDTDIKGSEPTVLNCDVPSMYQLIILLLEGMKGCCHDRLWNDESIPHKKEACPTALKVCEKIAKEAGLMGECESETSDEANAALKGKTPRKKKGKAKAKKEKPVLTKEFVNKKVIKLDEKKTKKTKKAK